MRNARLHQLPRGQWIPIAETYSNEYSNHISWRMKQNAPLTINEAKSFMAEGKLTMAQRRVGAERQLEVWRWTEYKLFADRKFHLLSSQEKSKLFGTEERS